MTDGNSNILIIIIVAALAAAIVAFLLVRSRSRARDRKPILSERSGDERPYVRQSPPPAPLPAPEPSPQRGVADEVATATSDVVGDVLGFDTQGRGERIGDDLQKLKGCGPKLAARLNELGVTTYAQLAGMNATELAMLDDRLGPFKGRIARDRLAEQADFLARGDTDGFQERFGNLGDA